MFPRFLLHIIAPTLLFIWCSFQVSAQVEEFIPYDNKIYEISAITVSGNQFSDANAIIGISGLRIGQKINIPGADIPNAIKAIYKQRLFTQVNIQIATQVQNVVSLQIIVEENLGILHIHSKELKNLPMKI